MSFIIVLIVHNGFAYRNLIVVKTTEIHVVETNQDNIVIVNILDNGRIK